MTENSENMSVLVKAINYAAIAHRNQLRKDNKTPYINHPIGVMNTLVQTANCHDINVLCGAVLHDTVEDTDTTIDDISREFGPEIASIVAEVTDDKSLTREKRKRLQEKHSPHLSFAAKLVKLSDKLYNLNDLLTNPPVGWTETRIQEYFEWASRVIVGMIGTNEAIEQQLRQVLAIKGVEIPDK
ncbi:guanosine-3',5'-bis(diphosphate) 3'-pyrophosphohydrolase MESH1-like [Oppia nitens]|uniref:guanosine-3',5'-bis(diphosphate) 3'-pyrophosphohydrolase MESH1-like n=1 Tax=Oppia nitens TaxID=1686743 RepID=UPI0023DAB119|nr:guanosine-3',5'-bis(diphosphate) 3'-pyrophosphohydrolase MESH1-like [Oppia nitens]